MRLWLSTILSALLVAVAVAGDAETAEERPLPIKNLRAPLERYEDGALKTRLRAAEASMPLDGGPIIARDVVIERLARDGVTVEVRIEAEHCRYDRKTATCVCTGPVAMNARGVRIEGTGLRWTRGDELVTIPADAKVEVDRVLLPVGRISM